MLNRRFEVLDNEIDLFIRIKELKAMGYEEQDMYVITQDEESVSMLKGYTNVMIKEEEHSIFERFKSFLKGEDSVIDAFKRMGLEKDNKDYYYNEVKNGRLLLLVDKDYKSNYILGEDGLFIPIEAIENLSDETEEVENIKLDTEENIPPSIQKDIGIPVEENEDYIRELREEASMDDKTTK